MPYYEKLEKEMHILQTYLLKIAEKKYDSDYMYDETTRNVISKICLELISKKPDYPKIIDECIKWKRWDMLITVMNICPTKKGVINTILKNYERIDPMYQGQVLTFLCYLLKWSNQELNDVTLQVLKKQNMKPEIPETDNDGVLAVYYPLGWNESIIEAMHNPCWCSTAEEAAAWCVRSKSFCSKTIDLPKEYIAGENEYNDIDLIKTRILKAKIKKEDVLAVIDRKSLNTKIILPQTNIIQHNAVYDPKLLGAEDTEDLQINYIFPFVAKKYEGKSIDEVDNLAGNIYDRLNLNCEKKGLPAFVDVETLQNRKMEAAKDVALLIRARSRMTQKEAVDRASQICNFNKNAKWIITGSPKYKLKKGYYYRALGYSDYDNTLNAVLIRAKSQNSIDVVTTQAMVDKFHGFLGVFAIDYESEGTTNKECQMKCFQMMGRTQKENEVVKKRELTAEEKEALKKEYLAELEEMVRSEIQQKDDLIESSKNENEKLRQKVEEMSQQISELQRQVEQKQTIIDRQDKVAVITAGKEQQKYPDETRSIILSALQHEMRNCESGSRRYDVISDLLESNTAGNDTRKERLATLKQITKGYRIASNMMVDLQKIGFVYSDEGRHPKIQFPGDDRYIVTCASTTSDVRAGENLYALIKKKFF